MEFVDVVMKRRAVRRFEEGGVGRDVIERIARLAQRSPSAGFSQGQRLVVVTEPERRREVARICGEEFYADVFGPWISECAAQFVPCVSADIYHRRYQEADKVEERRVRDRVAGPLLVRRRRRHDADDLARCGERGPGLRIRRRRTTSTRSGLRSGSRTSSRRSASCRSGRPLPDVRSPSLKRGWVPFEQFARWEHWGQD